jgi:Chlorite dismutase
VKGRKPEQVGSAGPTIGSATLGHRFAVSVDAPRLMQAWYCARVTPPLQVSFAGGSTGEWRIDRMIAVRGDGLASAERLAVLEGYAAGVPAGAAWVLRGVTSYERYVTRSEREALAAGQPPLGRPEATQAALIPIRKTEAWWVLAQDERRVVFEERSHHIAIGLEYLPGVARRLHHCRDLGEPFDFLTWFEYPPSSAAAFDELVKRLRATDEWSYVEREIDIRLSWDSTVSDSPTSGPGGD